eukprot:GFUD01008651.1.p1 GENE.GFUD01008651.1~~GFUD01008651.1.p1  ORF type:complete len:673 (+),score=185.48 GFUD01008651.1:53-2071(+)
MSACDEEAASFENSQICIKTELVLEGDNGDFDMVVDQGMEVVKIGNIKSEKIDESMNSDSLIVFNELVLKCETNETTESDIDGPETDDDLETDDEDRTDLHDEHPYSWNETKLDRKTISLYKSDLNTTDDITEVLQSNLSKLKLQRVFHSNPYPAIVTEVSEGSIAEKEGIKKFDVIYQIKIAETNQVYFEAMSHKKGENPWYYKMDLQDNSQPNKHCLFTCCRESFNPPTSVQVNEGNEISNDGSDLFQGIVKLDCQVPKEVLQHFHEALDENVQRKRGRKRRSESPDKNDKKALKFSEEISRKQKKLESDPLDTDEPKERSQFKTLQERVKTLQMALDIQNNVLVEKNQIIKHLEKKMQDFSQEKLNKGCNSCARVEKEMQKREAKVKIQENKLKEFDKIIFDKSEIIINLESEKVTLTRELEKLSSLKKRLLNKKSSDENGVEIQEKIQNLTNPHVDRQQSDEQIRLTLGLMFTDCSNHFNDDKEVPRPPYSYENLIALAIKNSKRKRLEFDEICFFLAFHFPYFNQNTKWKTFMKNQLVSSKCFVRSSIQEVWEWKITDKPVEQQLLDASVVAMSKWRKKELKSSMRFPHLLGLMESGDLMKHFPHPHHFPQTMNQNIKIISIENTFEESQIDTTIDELEEAVDDPETIYFKEEEVNQDSTEMYILPS